MSRPSRPSSRRRWLVIALATAVVAALAGTGVLVARRVLAEPPSRLSAAMELAPADAVRLTWTDWAAVRSELDATVSGSSSADDLDAFLGAAFDADLSAMSALISSAPVLQERYRLSPASLEWELYAQSRRGAVVLMGLPDDLDLDELRARLGRLGYRAPDTGDGVWDGGPELLPTIGSLTPELAYLRIDDEHRVLASSDQRAPLSPGEELRGAVAEPASGSSSADGSAGGIDAAVEALGEVVAAAVYSGDYACVGLALNQADAADQADGARLIEAAGGVHPLDAYAIGTQPGGSVRVTMALESEEAARADADSRSALASGQAPGQGGSFPDRFALDEATADGRVVTLGLSPRPGTFVLSDMASGPVLFATC
ncbi:hypothetical protein E8D34_05350 [Nocardioides sp. GY 10113]|uniref:hypothetical protein n=1 Tax=Nocardioides sp. GY 10113 TaxID=2569761 RepID=UPI0010A845FF|nr:hypothetical protein [Nocardioides sp. GY 10113]TIC88355.1 hypothetical protein E8D34_05350 [Nocardioides sp. GY 10113]